MAKPKIIAIALKIIIVGEEGGGGVGPKGPYIGGGNLLRSMGTVGIRSPLTISV